MTQLKRVKVIIGHAANARFWAEAGKDVGIIPRQADIPSPYAYGPDHTVFDWRGMNVIQVEVHHRRWEVFEVPKAMIQPMPVAEEG